MSSTDESLPSGTNSGLGAAYSEQRELVEESGAGVLLSYIYPNLTRDASEIEKIRKDNLKKLLKDKKLILVLDLDNILINAVLLDDLTDKEKYLLENVRKGSELLFKLQKHSMLVKLRPFVHTFLKDANEMFEMYIFTEGQQDYTKEVAKLLDPHGVYFPSRVICRPNNIASIKGLDKEIGIENVMIILTDTEKVWEDPENLIVTEKYKYFEHKVKELNPGMKSLSELKEDDIRSSGTLSRILHILKLVHDISYDPELLQAYEVDPASRDVRVMLKFAKNAILEGCKILFNGVLSSQLRPDEQHVWKLAEGMGAICCTDMEDLVTHVVAADGGNLVAKWARDNNKFLVTTHWIETAHYLWYRPDEKDFPVM